MANGTDGYWPAIDTLRERLSAAEARVAVLETEIKGLREDFREGFSGINGRLDRTRNTALALLAIAVPIITFLAGALLQSGGGS